MNGWVGGRRKTQIIFGVNYTRNSCQFSVTLRTVSFVEVVEMNLMHFVM